MALVVANGKTFESVEQIDFIDIGCSAGGSFKLIQKKYGYKNGLAIDIEQAKVEKAKSNNVPAICLDAAKLGIFNNNACKLVSYVHMLEHLPNQELVKSIISSGIRVASDTVYIKGPMYYLDYLKPLGFQFYWSHWRGHTYLIEPDEILEIVDEITKASCEKIEWSHELNFINKVNSSTDPCIHPINGHLDRHAYDSNIDPPKEMDVVFEKDIYREFELIITLKK